VTGWTYVSKLEQIALSDYPYYSDRFDDRNLSNAGGKLWEKVFSDSSGKTRLNYFQGNRYYSIFVCARSGRKLFFAHEKKLHCPLVYYEFCARVCCYLKPLATDQTDELLSKAMG